MNSEIIRAIVKQGGIFTRMQNADEIIKALEMQRHSREGGYFRETFRSIVKTEATRGNFDPLPFERHGGFALASGAFG